MKVLIISADIERTHAIHLARAGFVVDQASTLEEAVAHFRASAYDAVLAEPTPALPLSEIIPFLHHHTTTLHSTPVLVVTPPGAGATAAPLPSGMNYVDDCPVTELSTILQRARNHHAPEEKSCTSFGDLCINHDTRTVTLGGATLKLTAREYLLVDLLARNPGRLYTRAEILDRVWESEYVGDGRVIDTYVKKLRQKLSVDCIETVRGLGYRFATDVTSQSTSGTQAPAPERQLSLDIIALIAQALQDAPDTSHALAAVHQHLKDAFGIRVMVITDQQSRVLHSATPLNETDILAVQEVVQAAENSQKPGCFYPGTDLECAERANVQEAVSVRLTRRHDDHIAHLVLLQDQNSLAWTPEDRRMLRTLAAVSQPSFILHLQMSLPADRGAVEQDELDDAITDLDIVVEAEQPLTLDQLLETGVQRLANVLNATACVLWRIDAGEADLVSAQGPAGPLTAHSALERESFAASTELTCLPHILQARAQAVFALTLPARTHLLTTIEATNYILQVFALPSGAAESSHATRAVELFGEALTSCLTNAQPYRGSFCDEMTSMRNRRAFLYDLDSELSFAQENNTSFEVVFLSVQPQQGQQMGLDQQAEVARHVQSLFRKQDRVYVLNNGMYGALLAVPEHNARTVLRRKLTNLAALLQQDQPDMFQVSGRTVTFPTDAANLTQVLYIGFNPAHPMLESPSRICRSA
ncbi:winged helix-turn-helix domain-containing protein [Deinococcus deserti]|uniref:Putative response regulator, OmpR n=1 Tax=Deinococcus deserti (strain DSM 17065 / CIP 109153 / LMG 22923 / VCD115) TaxID=546414 RepID=C1D266_DEIDV|nr:winged helix-turn-helix domain-containing protein [Deinococcus deserti]ACO47505.1 putative response regulator, OmpR [Deinococcus deserti VCD115]